jgi:phosphatidylethanolamine-binding protein (PEBP) family uncharacterized protein
MDPSVVGRLLRGLRADASRSPLAAKGFDAPSIITVTSPSFVDDGPIPRRHAGRGVGDNVLLLDDIDVPLPKPLFHNAAVLDPDRESLAEGEFVDETPGVRNVATMLSKTGYSGPRPIPGHGAHRYRFHVMALARRVPEDATSVKAVLAAASGQVLARGTLTGVYER